MNAPTPTATLMSGNEFRESLRRYKPRVFLDGQQVANVVDERGLVQASISGGWGCHRIRSRARPHPQSLADRPSTANGRMRPGPIIRHEGRGRVVTGVNLWKSGA